MSKPYRPDMPQPPPGGARPAPPPDPRAEARPKPKPKTKSPSPWPWGRFTRIVASLAIAFHVVAVFSAPWAIQLRDSRQPWLEPGRLSTEEEDRTLPWQEPVLPGAIAHCCWYYANLLYINIGYNFFSPNPGVSHIVEYRIFDEADQEIHNGQMPDRREHWPRLLYHRHMMLVEQSAEPNSGIKDWVNHIGDRLLKIHGGQRVRLDLVRHHLLTPAQILAGEKIDSRNTYSPAGGLDHYRRPEAVEPPANEPQGGGR